MWRTQFLALLALLPFVALWPANASADGEIAVKVVSVDDSRFPTVSAVFTADEAGRPLTGLTAANVVATEGGSPATVVSLQSASASAVPLGLVVTLDISGSMAGANLAQSQAAASALLKNMDPGDSAALITFADNVSVAVPPTSDIGVLVQALTTVRANGNTALYDAVGESGKLAASLGFQRRAVILLSDGEDFGGRSKLNREQSLVQAADGETLFYVIGVGTQIDRPYLEELAARSGGRFFSAGNAAEVPGIYANIESILRSQDLVTVASNAPASAQPKVTLAITQGTHTGSGELAYSSVRPAPTAVAAPTSAAFEQTPAVAPVAEAEPESESSGSGLLLGLGALVAVLILAAVAFVVIRRRRTAGEEDVPLEPARGATPLPRSVAAPREVAHGSLQTFRGAELLQRTPLQGPPVTIGKGFGCDVQLPLEGAPDAPRLRLWWRDCSPMMHALGHNEPTPLLNGSPFSWATLSPGDEVQVGPFALRWVSDGGSEAVAGG